MNCTPLSHLGRLPVLLLVEDNADHVLLAQMAFEEAGINIDLRVAQDGIECMDFLHRRGAHVNAPRPDLILLDIHMPRMDGYEVLRHIRTETSLQQLPVTVLTTSADLNDVARMHALGCNSYIVKPVSFEHFVEVTRQLVAYWFKLVVLPTAGKD